MPIDFTQLPDQPDDSDSLVNFNELPDQTGQFSSVSNPRYTIEEDEDGNLIIPPSDNAIIEFGKTALRGLLRTTGKAPFDFTSAVSRQLEARPEFIVGGPLARNKATEPFFQRLSEIGRVAKEFHSDLSKRVEEKVEGIESLKPSERISQLIAGGFDKKRIFSARNAERALQLGADGFGSLAVALGTAALTGPIMPAVILSSIEGEAAAREAEEAGASLETAANVSLATTAGTALLEKIGLDKLLKGSGSKAVSNLIKRGAMEKMIDSAKGISKSVLKGFITEGGTEGAQQVWQNLVAKVGYDDTRNLMEGVVDSIVAGGVSGSTIGGSISSFEQIANNLQQRGVTQEELEQAKMSIAAEIIDKSPEIDETIDKKLKEQKSRPITEKELTKENRREFNRMIEENEVQPIDPNIDQMIEKQRQVVGQEIETNQERLQQAQDEGFVSDDEFNSIIQSTEQQKLQKLIGIRKAINTSLPVQERIKLTEEVIKLRDANTTEELSAIYDNVEAISKAGSERLINIQKAKATKTRIVKDILSKQMRVSDPDIDVRIKPLDKDIGRLVNIETQSPARFFDSLDKTSDGSGVFNKFFTDKINEAEDSAISHTLPIENQIKKVLKESKLDEFSLNTETLIGDRVLTLNEMMYIYAARKSPDNLAAVVFGNKINMKQIREIHNKLTPVQKQAADRLANLYGVARDRTNETLINVTNGKRVLTPVAGRYMTIEREGVAHQTPMDEFIAEDKLRKSQKRAKVNDRSTIERTVYGENQPSARMDLIGGLIRHTRARERFNGYAPIIQELRSVFNDPDFQSDLLRHKKIGPEGMRIMERYLNIVTDENFYRGQSGVAPAIDKLRSNTAIAFLGIKAMTVLKQAPSYVLFAQHMKNPMRLLTAMPKTMASWQKTNDFVNERDPQMAARIPENELRDLQKQDPKLHQRLINRFGLATMKGILAMDRLVTLSGWMSVYEDALSDPNVSEKEAIKRAKNSVLRTQPVSKFKDLPFAFSESELRTFTLFASQLSQINQVVLRDAPRAVAEGKIGNASITASMAVLNQFLIYSLVYGRLPQDSEDWLGYARNQISWLLPIFGPLVSGLAQGFSGVPSGVSALDQVGGLASENTVKQKTRQAAALVGIGTATPIAGVIQAIDGAKQLINELPKAKNLKDVANSFEGFFRSEGFQSFLSERAKKTRQKIRASKARKAKLKGDDFRARLIELGVVKG